MELYVKPTGAPSIVLDNISDSMTVYELKQIIFDRRGELLLTGINSVNSLNPVLPKSEHITKGFQLTSDFNSRTLSDVGVRDKTTLYVASRFTGLNRNAIMKGSARKSTRTNRRNNRKSRRNKTRR